MQFIADGFRMGFASAIYAWPLVVAVVFFAVAVFRK